jgi:hypothetical protein
MCASLLLRSASWLSCGTVALVAVLAGTCRGCGGKLSIRSGDVAGSGVGPGAEDEHDGLVEGASPGVAFTVRVALLATVAGASLPEMAEGDGVTAEFGEEVAALAEHVGPVAEPRIAGRVPAAELTGGGDHLLVMAGAAQPGEVEGGPEPLVGQAGDSQALGGVFGDVVRYGLAAERLARARQVIAMADGPGVSLRTESKPDNGPCRSSGDSDSAGGLTDGITQHRGSEPGGRRLIVVNRGI